MYHVRLSDWVGAQLRRENQRSTKGLIYEIIYEMEIEKARQLPPIIFFIS